MTGCVTEQRSHIAAHRLRSQQRFFCNEDVRLSRPVTFLVSRGSRWIPRAAWSACLPYSCFFFFYSPPPFPSPLFYSSSKNIIHSHQLQHVSSSAQEANVNGYQTAAKGQKFRWGADSCMCVCVGACAHGLVDEYVDIFHVNHTSGKL